MRLLPTLLLAGLIACGKEADPESVQTPAKAAPATAMAAQSMVAGKQATAKAEMIPVPSDKQQLERMLAMGYTVHEDHMHPPGMKECPFNMGGSVVQ